MSYTRVNRFFADLPEKNDMKRRVLVTGAGGAQGTAVIEELLVNGYAVRALSSSGNGAARFADKGVEVATGDYGDAGSLKSTLAGVDYVFLNFPVQSDEAVAVRYSQAFIEALHSSAVKQVVYNTTAWYPDQPGGIVLHDIRIRMEALFRAAQLPMVILRPTLYLNNFLGPWSLPLILETGIIAYPVKANQPIAWTSHQALAAFAVQALEKEHLAGRRFDVGSYLLTGEEIAQQFSAHLHRPVQYTFMDPSVFEQKLALQAGEAPARVVADSYRYILAHPEPFRRVGTPALPDQLPASIQPLDEWLAAHLPTLV